ncbi:galactoside alpha-(1,2)-fucosyltransferase 2-like [Saccostrea cucullata]|uniref:galactoside alpha-(1,2)-fucosyltransferase 2-like n=1 Tax=Saccostrea cuccullata TaxID=36930 RepID=UPI002ED61D4B
MRKLSKYLLKIGLFTLAALVVISKLLSINRIPHQGLPKACIGFRGRLGNLMFQYAFLYSISKSKGLYPVIPENFELGNVFKINKTTLKQIGEENKACDSIPTFSEKWACSFDEQLINVPIFQSAKFNGYLQSWKYWIQRENGLRQTFKFQDRITERARKQLADIIGTSGFTCCSKNSTLVGVHVRRGDYTSKPVNDYGQITPNASYYENSLDYFENLYPSVLFIVASDDLKWTKDAFKNKTNVHISLGNSGPEDMALLSLTNHTIMSVGTFGWWVAWLTGGTTLYYKPVFAPGSRFAKDFNNDVSSFIYPGWIPME